MFDMSSLERSKRTRPLVGGVGIVRGVHAEELGLAESSFAFVDPWLP